MLRSLLRALPAAVTGGLLPLLACRAAPAEAPAESVLYENARVWVDAFAEAPAEALLVRGGRVVASGAAAELARRAGAPLRRVDLGGGVVIPGPIDAHGHLANLGLVLESVDLAGVASYAELVERVRARAAELPPGTWILGRGWDQTRWEGGGFPHHRELSQAVPEHPVWLRRVDGHAALANGHALAAAGLAGAEVPAVEGGSVLRGPDGAPSGVFVDRAMALVEAAIPPPGAADVRRRLLAAQEACLAVGLVGVHDMGLSELEARELRALEREGRWRLHVVGYLWANDGLPETLAARHPDAHDRDPASLVRIVGAKLMLDGALGSRGAALLADYSDAPGERGHLLSDPAAFGERLDRVLAAGLQPAVHAIGDRANRVLLDAYAQRLAHDPSLARLRPRVEHAQVVAPEDLARFGRLGVVLSMQPTHATSDMRWAEERLGPERVRGAYAWRRLAGDPATIALGSDFPVERPDPLEGLYAARTRADREGGPEGGWHPDQRLDAREALAGFTRAAAFAAGEEEHRGSLLPGRFADFVVLDVDPLTEPAERLLEARVLATVVAGEVAWRR